MQNAQIYQINFIIAFIANTTKNHGYSLAYIAITLIWPSSYESYYYNVDMAKYFQSQIKIW